MNTPKESHIPRTSIVPALVLVVGLATGALVGNVRQNIGNILGSETIAQRESGLDELIPDTEPAKMSTDNPYTFTFERQKAN